MLDKCLQSLEKVEKVLRSSFGPLGCRKVVAPAGQPMLVTSMGADLLAVIRPSHPVANIAVAGAMDFGAVHGDGSKRILLMVGAGLRQAVKLVQSADPGQARLYMAGLCQALAQLRAWHEFEARQAADALSQQPMLSGPWQHASNPIPQRRLDGAAVAAENRTALSVSTAHAQCCVLHVLAHTQLGTRVHQHVAADVLVPLLLELVLRRAQSFKGCGPPGGEECQLQGLLADLVSTPPLACVHGSSVSLSRLVPGLILHAAEFACTSQRTRWPPHPLRFVVFTCSLEPGMHASGAQLLVQTSEARQAALQAPLQALATLVAHLACAGVGLILCTHSCSSTAAALCTEAGVCLVSAVDSGEAQATMLVAGVTACTSSGSVLALSCEQLATQHVGHAVSAVEIVCHGGTGSMACQKAMILELGPQATSLLVADPSEAGARQYVRLLCATLRTLRSACHQSASLVPHQSLRVVPGGLAFDAALAARVQHQISVLHSSGTQPRLTATHWPQSQSSQCMLPALKVLHAMASACPWVMAQAAVGEPAQGPSASVTGLARSASRRHQALQLVHDLKTAHCARLSAAIGFGTASDCGLGFLHNQASLGRLTVGMPAQAGVVEGHALVLALWGTATSLLVQILRIDGVLSAKRLEGMRHEALATTAGSGSDCDGASDDSGSDWD